MNRHEFLLELRKKLHRLPQSEIDSAILYYQEYFEDAGLENEPRIIKELGSPASVAAKIVGEYALDDAAKSNRKGMHPIWIVLLTIFASPIALPLALTVVIVAISLIFSLLVVFISVGISFAAVVAAGIACLFAGGWALFTSFPTGIFFLGAGLLISSIGLCALIGIIKLSKIAFLGLQKSLGKFLIRRSGQ